MSWQARRRLGRQTLLALSVYAQGRQGSGKHT